MSMALPGCGQGTHLFTVAGQHWIFISCMFKTVHIAVLLHDECLVTKGSFQTHLTDPPGQSLEPGKAQAPKQAQGPLQVQALAQLLRR